MLGSTNQATAAAVHVEQRNGEITSHFQLLPVRTEAHQRTVEGAIARIRDGAVIVRVSVPPHPLDEGQPQKTSAGTLARGADLHEGTLIDASALRDLEPALGPAGPLVHLLPQAHGREVGSSARETGGVPRSFPDGAAPHAAAQALVYNGASAGAAMATSTSSSERTGTHLVTLAASNFLGPLLLGRFFDTIGRRTMITATYGISGVLLIATAVAFGLDAFSAWGQTFAWMLIFFFASAAASSAYLTASEIFPLETRALAIAIFYALGTAVGGTAAPLLFGYLVQSGSAWALAAGYAFAATLMLIAAAIAAKFGIDAEMRSLESIADPLSSGR